ncbi:MAG: hypothetical protein N4A59_06180 [Marinifilum sp.]|jgi:hypothetical protein|nr:hypothetical protein [Marinifilum sp.]
MKQGDKIKYTKGGEIKESVISAFSYHQNFIEIHLENGDAITDTEILNNMSKLPRFMHMVNTMTDETREFVVCTRKPACVAEAFEVDELQLTELQNNPPGDWSIKLNEQNLVIAAHTRHPLKGKYYVLVARQFFTEPTARDIPIEGSIVGGVMSRMCDWFFAYKKNELIK